jgi:hypothetical protein
MRGGMDIILDGVTVLQGYLIWAMTAMNIMEYLLLSGITVNLTADHNTSRCTDGFTAGWDSTCQQALSDPNAHHDIYGCPGVSDNQINMELNPDSQQYRAQHPEAAACLNAEQGTAFQGVPCA